MLIVDLHCDNIHKNETERTMFFYEFSSFSNFNPIQKQIANKISDKIPSI